MDITDKGTLQTLNIKILITSKNYLTVGFDLTVTAAVKKLSVVSPGTATGSVTVQSFEWKSVWVSTATGFFSRDTFDTWFDWASFVVAWVESVVVSVGVIVDLGSRQEEGEERVNKLSFNGASVSGTVIRVQGVTRVSQVDTSSGSWVVGDFPWDTRFTGGFGVDDGALVSISQSFAKSIDFVDWGTFPSSNVIIKVAPASVLVEGVDGVSDVSGESSEGRVSDKSKDLSVDAVFVSGGQSDQRGKGEFEHHFVFVFVNEF